MILAAPIVFLPLGFEREGVVEPSQWVLAWLGVAAFLVLFAVALVSGSGASRSCGSSCRWPGWVRCSRITRTPPFVFITYAACIVPWAVDGNRLATARYTLLLVGVLAALGNRTSEPELRNWYWVVCPVVCITFSMFFAWVVRTLPAGESSRQDRRARAHARDLHDVLGHTLSLIALKTELAGRQLC